MPRRTLTSRLLPRARSPASYACTSDALESRIKLCSLTATFLLTDVEGSTALWEQAPQEMTAGLARLDSVAGRVISEHGGTLAGSVGEGAPLAEFEAADTACACAIELQRAFGAEHWPTPVTVRVRIALHGGPARRRSTARRACGTSATAARSS